MPGVGVNCRSSSPSCPSPPQPSSLSVYENGFWENALLLNVSPGLSSLSNPVRTLHFCVLSNDQHYNKNSTHCRQLFFFFNVVVGEGVKVLVSSFHFELRLTLFVGESRRFGKQFLGSQYAFLFTYQCSVEYRDIGVFFLVRNT